jgi:hypothetical protein
MKNNNFVHYRRKCLLIITFILILFPSILNAQHPVLRVGFNIMIPVRSGITVGYSFSDYIAAEVNVGRMPRMFTFGFAVKYWPTGNHEDLYLIGGQSELVWAVRQRENIVEPIKTKINSRGLNLGFGYEIYGLTDMASVPIEIGVFSSFNKTHVPMTPSKKLYLEQKKMARDWFSLVPYFGFGCVVSPDRE